MLCTCGQRELSHDQKRAQCQKILYDDVNLQRRLRGDDVISFGVAHAHSGNYLNFTSGRRRRGSASPNLKVPNTTL